ncbi:hypothetical protein H6G97_14735 [Nostoc flagelliforme FACHB-838]|uniref:Uncharacterized protein n=1 Tax=Nostoc flagelliforme FACHB-838 TaxID=2692904 RepID=A0ABR8DMS7_9NOSO|nr:hypothetical protein [Nostoc flagelliforme]MBD2530762.1 hypothetical protein [Nostoc flagelliforme FACHB-838]
MWITSRYKVLPCNAIVGGSASQFDLQVLHSQAAAQERGINSILDHI